MDPKNLDPDEELRDPARAPEVAPSHSPEPVFWESEGLQHAGVDYDGGGKEAYYNDVDHTKADNYVAQDDGAYSSARRPWYKRKRWIAAIVVAVVVVVAVAVGAGVGASSSQGGGKDGKGQNQAEAPSPTSTPTTAPAPSSPTSGAAVAPATSGLASFTCSNGTYLYSAQPSGLAYIQDCHTIFYYNTPNIYTNQTVEGLYTSTKYSFQACVDSCDEWNAAHAVAAKPCMALSYYANLTNVFTEHQEWQGNCILKSGVGGVTTNITTSTDSGMDWAHTASAYRACLQEGIPC